MKRTSSSRTRRSRILLVASSLAGLLLAAFIFLGGEEAGARQSGETFQFTTFHVVSGAGLNADFAALANESFLAETAERASSLLAATGRFHMLPLSPYDTGAA